MDVFIVDGPPWSTVHVGERTVHVAGFLAGIDQVKSIIKKPGALNAQKLDKVLAKANEQFALLVVGADEVYAAVDRIRSYPLFYHSNHSSIFASHDAHWVAKRAGLSKFNSTSVFEFSMSGYVSGQETLLEGVLQLQAGERIYWSKGGQGPNRLRYYSYIPSPVVYASEKDRIQQLSEIVDRAISRTINVSNGAPIWIPLSGGLDCRLILCKLLEHGYDNIQTFSYGIRNNNEATVAQKIARHLGVRWRHVLPQTKRARRLFRDGSREDYWKFADGLCSIPSLREFDAFTYLKNRGLIQDDAVVINGQSGDFITGGHIRAAWLGDGPFGGVDDLLQAIQDKHYALWPGLLGSNGSDLVRQKISKVLDDIPTASKEDLISLYESWEWQERQSKYVCNGQRVYDYLGLKWTLPLWDGEFMDFWETASYEEKVGQALYTKYLKHYDYEGMFKNYRRTLYTFPPALRWLFLVGKAIGLFAGNARKQEFYQNMSYFGSYHHQYAYYGFSHFLARSKQIRGPVSLLVETWLEEHGIEFSALTELENPSKAVFERM